jgi:lysylphosphatidylglycerol synthetase-like protein (DUF2156 family)
MITFLLHAILVWEVGCKGRPLWRGCRYEIGLASRIERTSALKIIKTANPPNKGWLDCGKQFVPKPMYFACVAISVVFTAGQHLLASTTASYSTSLSCVHTTISFYTSTTSLLHRNNWQKAGFLCSSL